MKNSRRAFLQAAGMVPATLLPGLACAAGASHRPAQSGEIRRAHFAGLTGERFEFEKDDSQKVGATLISANPLEAAAHEDRSFRLLFDVEKDSRLTQGSWLVTHPMVGSRVIFVSPNDARGRRVEAIFNRV